MTAYSRVAKPSSIGRWLVELHSVNRKTLDFSIYLPKDFLQFDLEIRKWLSKYIKRGQVTVKITLCGDGVTTEMMQIPIAHLKSLKSWMEKTASDLGFSPQEITFPLLIQQLQSGASPEISEDEDSVREILMGLLDDAVKIFLKMRECEGRNLATEIEKHLKVIQNYLLDIEKRIGVAEEKYRKKNYGSLARIQSHRKRRAR